MTSGGRSVYWRLSAFYLFYFASLGALVPYWSVYLKHRGYEAAAIGELMAILMATKIVAPNVWGWIADHTGRRMGIIRAASLWGALAFAGVLVPGGYWWLALVMAVFSFFWNASLPQFEAVTMNHLGADTHRYTMVRLWGSIGFILTVAGLGTVLDVGGLELLPPLVLALFAGIWLSTLVVPADPAGRPRAAPHEPLRRVLGRREVVALLAVCFLMQASHGPYYTFFTIYLEDLGWRRGAVGGLWALGVGAEIAVFMIMHRWLPRFGPRTLLLWSLALTTLRWILIALVPAHLPSLLLAQCLHAASFGVYHAVAISLIHELFTGPHQGRGQALYSSVSFGAGGALGSLASGYLWDGVGAPATYLAAAGLSAAAWVVAARGVRRRV